MLPTYYKVTIDGSEEEGRVHTYVHEDLVDATTGVAFDLFVPDPLLVKAKAFVAHKRKKLPDLLWVRCASWFLISQRALDVFLQVRCCDSIRWIETAVCHGKTVLAVYWLAYNVKEHDIWDYGRSDFYWYPGKTPHTLEAAGYMREGIVDSRCIPKDYDFIRATQGEWIGTGKLRQAVESNGLSGFEFGTPGISQFLRRTEPMKD